MYHYNCAICGIPCTAKTKTALYCRPCAEIQKAKYQQEIRARNRERKREQRLLAQANMTSLEMAAVQAAEMGLSYGRGMAAGITQNKNK